MPPLVVIGRFRYINAKIMSAGHDWAEENSDLPGLKGLIKVDTFHIAPDREMAVFHLRTGEHLKAALPLLKNSFSDCSKMFDCKITWEMGVFNDSLSKKTDLSGQLVTHSHPLPLMMVGTKTDNDFITGIMLPDITWNLFSKVVHAKFLIEKRGIIFV